MRPIQTPRLLSAGCAILLVCVGLAVRSRGIGLPPFFAKYAGDALWAAMVFFLIAFLFPRQRLLARAICAFLFSCAVEFSQIYHAPWIDSIRHTTLGALALGSVFSWPDMAAYAAGVVLAMGMNVLGSRIDSPAG